MFPFFSLNKALCLQKPFIFYFNYILLIMLLQLSHYFLPLFPLCPAHPLLLAFPPPQFMSIGHTYKFFGFSISYTILTLPLSILYLPSMILIPCTFSPILPLLITLHAISISVILFLFQLVAQFVFVFLGSVLDSCQFVVSLLFIVLIFLFLLDKSL